MRSFVWHLPEGPPNIKTHDIQPKEGSQKGKQHDVGCNKGMNVSRFPEAGAPGQ